MNEKKIKQEMIEIGMLLWQKDLASGLNGNISSRLDERTILLTAHATCLGRLTESDILKVNLNGEVIGHGEISTENLLHREIYKNYSQTKAVIHTHTSFINGYFLSQDEFSPEIFEAKHQLGRIRAVPQATPSVADSAPVMEALKKNNIVVLKNHGVVAIGENHFDCFVVIQALEEAIKTHAVSQIYKGNRENIGSNKPRASASSAQQAYKLFSDEQIEGIVQLVNSDGQMKSLGEKTQMTMDLAVKLDETGKTYCFSFENGRIAKVGKNDDAEFLITAPASVWRAVFKREIDPFVATTQKKMNLRGDFAKISKWYAPCSRIFELWTQVPVE